MPKEIVEALSKKRIRVSPQMASMIESKANGRKRRNGRLGVDHLVAAKVLVQRCGSVEEAKKAVSALAKLL